MVDVKFGDIMRKAVITVKKMDTIDKVVKIMSKIGIGGVVVTENGKVVGILTEKDIIREVVAKGKNPKKVKVKSIMTSPVRTVKAETDVEEGFRIMRDLDIERLPVVMKGKLIGLVTERDLVRVEPALRTLMEDKVDIPSISKGKKFYFSGFCENCRNYSDELKNMEERLFCEDCR
jgi:CBS domain-containing protein